MTYTVFFSLFYYVGDPANITLALPTFVMENLDLYPQVVQIRAREFLTMFRLA